MGRMWRTASQFFILLFISALQLACSLDATLLFNSFAALPYTPPGAGTDTGTFVVPNIYAPTTKSHLSDLKTFVHGEDLVAYKYKVGVAASTSCADETGYSSEITITTPINEALATNGVDYRACVVGKTSTGLWTPYASASSSTWYKDSRMSLPFGVGGYFERAAFDGTNTLYTIMGPMGVIIYDTTDIASLKPVGVFETREGLTSDVVLNGTILYVAQDTNGSGAPVGTGQIDIVDVSDKTKPRKINSVITASKPKSVTIAGGFLYVGERNHLQIFDLSDPLAPASVAQFGTSKIWDIAVSGNYAYVAGENVDLRVFDISTRSAPSLVGTFVGTGTGSASLALSGTIAIVATASGNTRAIDISTPSNPTQLSSVSVGYGSAVSILGTTAVVGASAFNVIDISNPAAITVLASVASDGTRATDVHNNGSTFFAINTNKIRVLDISTPTTPVVLSTYQGFGGDWADSIYADDDDHYVYVGDGDGFVTLDVTNRYLPKLVNIDVSLAQVRDIKKSGNFLFLAHTSGLKVLDVTDPESPITAGSFATASNATGLEILGSSLVLTAGSDLYTLDISDPTHPIQQGTLVLSCSPVGLVASTNYAYAGCGSSLEVIDISNKSALTLKSSTAEQIEDLAFSGNYVFIVTGQDDIMIYDVSDATAPVVATTVQPASTVNLGYGISYGVEYRDGYLYVADWEYLSVIDVRNPLQPSLVSYYDVTSTRDASLWRVWPTKNSVMIADGYYGFRMLHIGDPSLIQAK